MNTRPDPVNALRYPGQYFDQETGLNYNYFRDYEPSTGRYVESDPIGLKGGASTFSYVQLNPLSFIDPKGLIRVDGCNGCSPNDVEETQRSANEWCDWAARNNNIKDVVKRNCIKNSCSKGSVSCKSDCTPKKACGKAAGIPRGYWDPNSGEPPVICLNQKAAAGGRGSTAIHEIAHSCGWNHGDGGGVPNDPGPDLPCEATQ